MAEKNPTITEAAQSVAQQPVSVVIEKQNTQPYGISDLQGLPVIVVTEADQLAGRVAHLINGIGALSRQLDTPKRGYAAGRAIDPRLAVAMQVNALLSAGAPKSAAPLTSGMSISDAGVKPQVPFQPTPQARATAELVSVSPFAETEFALPVTTIPDNRESGVLATPPPIAQLRGAPKVQPSSSAGLPPIVNPPAISLSAGAVPPLLVPPHFEKPAPKNLTDLNDLRWHSVLAKFMNLYLGKGRSNPTAFAQACRDVGLFEVLRTAAPTTILENARVDLDLIVLLLLEKGVMRDDGLIQFKAKISDEVSASFLMEKHNNDIELGICKHPACTIVVDISTPLFVVGQNNPTEFNRIKLENYIPSLEAGQLLVREKVQVISDGIRDPDMKFVCSSRETGAALSPIIAYGTGQKAELDSIRNDAVLSFVVVKWLTALLS